MKWISVEENVPSFGSAALCYNPQHNIFVAWYKKDVWNGGGANRDKNCGYWEWDVGEEEVTHWMPLPEKPEIKINTEKSQP